MASRPLVTVQLTGEKKAALALPTVFLSPIRSDVVRDVHTKMNKNHRQPYAVNNMAGMDTAAESWGTGRAVSRIPRVPGGGSHRSGQGAFGNMCRKGRMFAPTKVWRRWHIRISKGQRRFATCSALAATAVPALVQARGHRIERVPEVPLVVSDAEANKLAKTKDAVKLLTSIGAYEDVLRSKDSRHVRSGQGKSRNRRYVSRRGPLVVFGNENPRKLVLSLRNLPGVDLCHVSRLNLLTLAPGGHLGRFVVWTESAFRSLNSVYGTRTVDSDLKQGFRPPRPVLANADISRIINSESVQAALRPAQHQQRFHPRKKNPLTNLGAMVKLNPYALTQRRRAILQSQKAKKARTEQVKNKRAVFLQRLNTPSVAPPRGADESDPTF